MENGAIIESVQWNNNSLLFGFLTLFPYLASASPRWTWASWACPWPSNRCRRCWPAARGWSGSRRGAARTWRSRPVGTECSSPPVFFLGGGGDKVEAVGRSRRYNAGVQSVCMEHLRALLSLFRWERLGGGAPQCWGPWGHKTEVDQWGLCL